MSKITTIIESVPLEIRMVLKTLSDDTRLAIVLTLLREGEMSFSKLEKTLGLSRNTLSHHIRILSQKAFIVNYYIKKEGTSTYSFYNTTNLLNDCMDKLFSISETRIVALEILSRHKLENQLHSKGRKEILTEPLQNYSPMKVVNPIIFPTNVT